MMQTRRPFRPRVGLSYSSEANDETMSIPRTESTTVANVGRLILGRDGPDPILLLGAGASVKSGVPAAGDVAAMAVKWAYCREHGRARQDPHVKRSDWWEWLKQHEWYRPGAPMIEQYPQIIEHLLRPRDDRRDFFANALRPQLPPSPGYAALAELVVAGLVRTVLTTNFDPLVPEALRARRELRIVNTVESPSDVTVVSTAPDYPQVVFLHGSVRHYSDQNLLRETKTLQPHLRDALRPLLRDHPLVVLGYRGAEPSIMVDLLANGADGADGYRKGIYWCALDDEELNPLVSQLADRIGSNFQTVRISGFDECLIEWGEMAGRERPRKPVIPSSGERPDVADMQPAGCALEELDWNLLAEKLEQYGRRLQLDPTAVDDRPALTRRMRELDLAFDDAGGARATKAAELLFARGPITEVVVRYAGASTPVRGNLFAVLDRVEAMIEEVNAPFRLKGRTSETVRPYDPQAVKELLVNALVHRDHTANSPVRISLSRHNFSVSSPGGLVPTLDPTRLGQPGHKAYRNPVIADLLYGTGAMDKAGSGLADARRLARAAGGDATFGPNEGNTAFVAALRGRAQQPDPATGTAAAASSERFLTNLLRVRIEAESLQTARCASRYRDIEERHPVDDLPAFFLYEEKLWTFSDLSDASNPLASEVLGRIEEVPVTSLLGDPDRERLVVQLLNRTLLAYARKKGLCTHRRSQRLWFPRSDDGKRHVTYRARVREATRTVTKPLVSRAHARKTRWEHESLRFSFRRYGNEWMLHLVPGWVFTHDGRDDLMRGPKVARLATRRSARDFNPQVANDLYFWVWVLAEGRESTALDPRGSVLIASRLEFVDVLDAPTPVGARFAALATTAGRKDKESERADRPEDIADELAEIDAGEQA